MTEHTPARQPSVDSLLDTPLQEAVPQRSESVVAVVVTFQPELAALLLQIKALRPQVARLVVVDNASTADLAEWCRAAAPQVDAVLRMEHNLGIGGAQNHGIAWARTQGASHVLLMDQDSVPEPGMVGQLLGALPRRCVFTTAYTALLAHCTPTRANPSRIPRSCGWRACVFAGLAAHPTWYMWWTT